MEIISNKKRVHKNYNKYQNKGNKKIQIYNKRKILYHKKRDSRGKQKQIILIESLIKIIVLLFLIILYLLIYYALHINASANAKIKDNLYNKYNYMLFINKLKKMKKVIYTANLGKYDKIRPIRKEEGWNYIYFIDWEISEEEKNNNTNWTFVMIPDYVKNMNISIAKKQRFIKINPHLFLKDYELSIYIDSCFTLFGDINDLIIRILPYNINIVVLEHRGRKTVYEELDAVVYYRKEKKSMNKKIKERYNSEHF